MFGIGFWEWIVILTIVILLFGSGRISKLSEEIGKSVLAFKKGMKSESNNKKPIVKMTKKKSVKNKKK
ncbi:MAG: twin-arginine translocase TatA/TatE family subunit [Rickettsiales bacterium]|jgi:sec-independent protein translocase protein TatA|nr:twin-arginine translocase TatA/TatE family subunit [Rickettsiales bacterium]